MRAHRILHLSDTHLTGTGFDEDGVDTAASLDRILYDVRFVPGIDAVVVSGDLADDGSPGGYAAVLDRIGAFAAERGIPHVYCTGNHDDRDAFAAALGTGHRGADGTDVGAAGPGRAAVSDVAGLRVITLDSLVPGSVHGVVGDAQLAWLRDVLARPSDAGSVLVLHHPPIAVPATPLLPSVALHDPERLGAVLAGSDVRAVLCGHFHTPVAGSLAGVPVWVTPGVATGMDLTAPPHLHRGVLGAGATIVDLGGPGTPMFHTVAARDPAAGRQVYLVDAASGADVPDETATP